MSEPKHVRSLPALTASVGVGGMPCTLIAVLFEATYGPQPVTRLAPLDVATARYVYVDAVGAVAVNASSAAGTVNVSPAPVPAICAAVESAHDVPPFVDTSRRYVQFTCDVPSETEPVEPLQMFAVDVDATCTVGRGLKLTL